MPIAAEALDCTETERVGPNERGLGMKVREGAGVERKAHSRELLESACSVFSPYALTMKNL